MALLLRADCKYVGTKSCQNADYAQILFSTSEIIRGFTIPAEQIGEGNIRCLCASNKLQESIRGLEPGRHYHVEFGVAVSTNRKTGYTNLQFDLVKVHGALSKAA